MATKLFCDGCTKEVKPPCGVYRVKFKDGEHPHNGSTMWTLIDLCSDCTSRVQDLVTHQELDEFKRIVTK